MGFQILFPCLPGAKRERTTSSVEKILDAIVLAKNIMPYYSKMLCCIF